MAEQPKPVEAKTVAVNVIGTVDPSAQPLPGSSPADLPVTQQYRPSETPNEEPADMVPTPQAAQTVAQPGPNNLPPADSVVAKQAAELGLFVVDAERDGPHLYLVIEGGSVEETQGYDARKLAYDARFHYGFDNSGIEPHGGPEPVKESKGRYRQTWKLTRGL